MTIQLEALTEAIRGEILTAGTPGYDEARALWNGMIDKRPGAIVRCTGVADVIATVNFAREQDLPLAIKAGGHNVSGKAMCDDGIVIDLSPMNNVHIDPIARRARAGAGAKWGAFDHEAQAFGLTTTGGVVSSTGVAGLTLGGGIGYLTRTYGLACDNLLSVDLVTAAGELVRASEDENPELFWALRGGGGNFGVVTSLEFQLHSVGPMVATATIFHAIEDARSVLDLYRTFNETAPDELACYAMIVNAPEDLPDQQGKAVLAIVGLYSGNAEEGLQLMAPLADMGSPLVALIDPMPYTVMQTAFDAGNPHGARYYWKSQYLGGLDDAFLDIVVDRAMDIRGDHTIIGIEPMGGAQGRVDPGATAFACRNVPYSLGIWAGWQDPGQDDANIAWTRAFFDAVAPFGVGAYVNYLGEDESDRLDEVYGENYDRLKAVKQKWDPNNLFRLNHNIA
ncbi:MAG: FAD-binding oxidoreductase [Gammaproteobacteria bacterium]|nr:MAG: FAD-binding oxidoreductase [Gammaproteobacteria bacterium]